MLQLFGSEVMCYFVCDSIIILLKLLLLTFLNCGMITSITIMHVRSPAEAVATLTSAFCRLYHMTATRGKTWLNIVFVCVSFETDNKSCFQPIWSQTFNVMVSRLMRGDDWREMDPSNHFQMRMWVKLNFHSISLSFTFFVYFRLVERQLTSAFLYGEVPTVYEPISDEQEAEFRLFMFYKFVKLKLSRFFILSSR